MTLEERCKTLEEAVARLEAGVVPSKDLAEQLVDNRLAVWAERVTKIVGIPSLMAFTGLLFYIFMYLPGQAGAIALENSAELREEIRQVSNEIAVQEHVLKKTSERLENHHEEIGQKLADLDLRTEGEETRVSNLTKLVNKRQAELRGGLDGLQRTLNDSAERIESEIDRHNHRLGLIGERIATFEGAVDEFRGEQGKLLFGRVVRFAKVLKDNDGMQILATIQKDLDELKEGHFDELECQSLSIVGGRAARTEVVRLFVDEDGAGRLITNDPEGKLMCALGRSELGTGMVATYRKDHASGPPSSKMYADADGNGVLQTSNASGEPLCVMHTSDSGHGMMSIYNRAGKTVCVSSADKNGAGAIEARSAAGERRCSIGSNEHGDGGFWAFNDTKLLFGSIEVHGE
ncbi:MAG: hypothetical protein GXP29_04120 [Planctomycetes bacterium]|nr:hypothetical protein [Planctomycetota bacterium]